MRCAQIGLVALLSVALLTACGAHGPTVALPAAARGSQAADLQHRFDQRIPSPGTEASLRRYIESLETGTPNYNEMAPALAALVRQKLPTILKMINEMGEFRSLTFKGVGYDGWDVYYATFDNGLIEWRIAPLSADGKAGWRGYRRLP
jgi:predicted small lipoprotein YifL